MRQVVITLSLSGSFLLFSLTTKLFDTLLMFVLFGIVPGQSEPIPAETMLRFYAVSAIILIAFAIRGSLTTALQSASLRLPSKTA